MDSGQLQNTLKALCKVMWDNNVTNLLAKTFRGEL